MDLRLDRDREEDELDAARRELVAQLEQSRHGVGLRHGVAGAVGAAAGQLALREERVAGEVVEGGAEVEPALATDENLAVAVAQMAREQRLGGRAQGGREGGLAAQPILEGGDALAQLAIRGQGTGAPPGVEKDPWRRYRRAARERRRLAAAGARRFQQGADGDRREQPEGEHEGAGAGEARRRDLGDRLFFPRGVGERGCRAGSSEDVVDEGVVVLRRERGDRRHEEGEGERDLQRRELPRPGPALLGAPDHGRRDGEGERQIRARAAGRRGAAPRRPPRRCRTSCRDRRARPAGRRRGRRPSSPARARRSCATRAARGIQP